MNRYTYYAKWFDQLDQKLKDFDRLFQLFHQLLLQTNGDASKALSWMTRMNDRYGYTDDLGSFIDKLKEKGLIKENNNIYLLTPKGNRTIRQSSFDYIFSNLKKTSPVLPDVFEISLFFSVFFSM